jgi:hypothetical protein
MSNLHLSNGSTTAYEQQDSSVEHQQEHLEAIQDLPAVIRAIVAVLLQQGDQLMVGTAYLHRRDSKPQIVASAEELRIYLDGLNPEARALAIQNMVRTYGTMVAR